MREELLALGVQEFEIWGKAELEDRLFQPKNDHLLFAYFGFSLQVRRRSLKADVRARLPTKRAVAKAVSPDGMQRHLAWAVLIRDPTDDRYPFALRVPDFLERSPWRYYHPEGYHPPDHIVFVVAEYLAYWDRQTGEWDAIMEYNAAILSHPVLAHTPPRSEARWKEQERARTYSTAHVPPEMAARYMKFGLLHYDRILGVDLEGDAVNEGPHLLVDYGSDGPFDRTVFNLVGSDTTGGRPRSIRVDDSKRIAVFPVPLPELAVEQQEVSDDESPL